MNFETNRNSRKNQLQLRNTNQMKLKITLLVCLLSLLGYSQETSGVAFIQNGKTQLLTDTLSIITLERVPFSIQFQAKKYSSEHFYATQIAVVSSQAALFQARVGQKTEAIPYFEPGTGMAPNDSNFYNTMIVSDLAHHYIYYESENDKRAHLVSQKNNELRLEWKIENCYFDGTDSTFAELPAKKLYFILFSDFNLDGTINQGELNLVKVQFKDK